MGDALIAAAALFTLMNTGLLPGGGNALQLSGGLLAIAIAANFALGAPMTAGVGLYAPCLVLVSLLGMDPIAAFPNHDGVVRVPDAGRVAALHSFEQL